MSALVHWFDLSRFSAAIKVVPSSPLRGIAMTCLDVLDEDAFTRHVHAASEEEGRSDPSARRRRTEEWWDRMKALGFSTRAEFYDGTSESGARAFRLYSDRQKFTLAELQSIVPGVAAEDLKPMKVDAIVQRPVVDAALAGEWKQFAETVLASEAIAVWAPKINPFDKRWEDAGGIDEAAALAVKAGRSPIFGTELRSRWVANELTKARYRENALVAFYADPEAAVAAGLQPDEIEEISLPYALPLWVERDGRVVALKDVRHAPELLTLPPSSYVGEVASNVAGGIVVGALREARELVALHREEASRWLSWSEAEDAVDREILRASLQRVVAAETAFRDRFATASGPIDKLLAEDGSMSPMERWGEVERRAVAALAQRLMPDEAANRVFEVLTAIDVRLQKQDAARAREVAATELDRIVDALQANEGVNAPQADGTRHEDAGEKIGGARKDFHRRAMTPEDLEALTDYERESLVVKKNVWPAIDYGALRDEGVSAKAAIAIKYLKDAINVEPDRRHRMLADNPEEHYIQAVAAVRDAMAEVKTLEDFKEACLRLFKTGRGENNYIYGGSSFQVALGSEASHLLHDSEVTLGWGDNARTEASVPQKIRRELLKRERRVAGWGETATEDQLWGTLIKAKREKSEAEKEVQAEKAEQEQELHRPHLVAVERVGGKDWRGGKDVTASDLIDHFGFRGIEFGNWLPQDERQAVLNMSFDSLCDLADAVGVPPKAISFDGELAVAFGARGRGGKNAALAHYEPGRDVINLTRMKGAGTLAHEWFHALDWHLGEKSGFLTEKKRPRFADDPMPKLVEAMRQRPATAAEVRDRAEKEAQKHKRNAESWCYRLPPESRAELGRVMDELVTRARAAVHEDASRALASRRPGGNSIHPFGAALGQVQDIAENICEIVKNHCKTEGKGLLRKEADAVDGNVQWMLRHMSRLVTVEAAEEQGVKLDDGFLGGDNAVETRYFQQAKALDDKRSAKYWSTDIEMFARAGAQFVLYELADRGVRSDYLVYGSDEERYADHPLGNPNPAGADRVALREHFSALIDEYRVHLLRSRDADCVVEP